jgi:tRNA(Ile)-lysidine synthase
MQLVESTLLSFYESFINTKKKTNNLWTIKNYSIAFSGGLDSTVLLFASYQLALNKKIPPIKALHINHSIQKLSLLWQQHCEFFCKKKGIDFEVKKLHLLSEQQQETQTIYSENKARKARYISFQSYLDHNDVIALAHHQDDQAETLLFRLFRGTGIHGASGIPSVRGLGKGELIRPFLSLSKKDLFYYAKQNKLDWVNDPSNVKCDYSRNKIRNDWLPKIEKDWPKVKQSLARFSRIASAQNKLLKLLAKDDLKRVIFNDDPNRICLYRFNQLTKENQCNLLHFWSQKEYSIEKNTEYLESEQGYSATEQAITELLHQLQHKKENQWAEFKMNVRLGQYSIRYYDKKLWKCSPIECRKLKKSFIIDSLTETVILSSSHELIATFYNQSSSQYAIRPPQKDETVYLKARKSGEKIQPHYRQHRCSLKKIYQELKVPYWDREWLPLIYYNNELVAVPGVFVNQAFRSSHQSLVFTLKLLSI